MVVMLHVLCAIGAASAAADHTFGHDVFLEDSFHMLGPDISAADTDRNGKLSVIETYKMVKRVHARRFGGVERLGHLRMFEKVDDGIGNKGDGVASVEDAFHFLNMVAIVSPEEELGYSVPEDKNDPLKTFMLIATSFKGFNGARKDCSPKERAIIEDIFELVDPGNPYAKDYVTAEKLIHYLVVNRDHRQLSRDIVEFFGYADMDSDKSLSDAELRQIDLYRVPVSIQRVFKNGQTILSATTPEEVKWLKHATENAVLAATQNTPAQTDAKEVAELRTAVADLHEKRATQRNNGNVDVMGRPIQRTEL